MSSSEAVPNWAWTSIAPPLPFSTSALNFSAASQRMCPVLKGLPMRMVILSADGLLRADQEKAQRNHDRKDEETISGFHFLTSPPLIFWPAIL